VLLNASSPSEIDSAFATLVNQRVGALVVTGENFFFTQRDLLVELAARHAMPTIYGYSEIVRGGGLISYGARYAEAFRLLGINTVASSRAKKPPACRCSKSRKSSLSLTSRRLTHSATIPLTLLGRADEVIE
jgi:hypothetical protein